MSAANVASFDIEEHYRIEAAAELNCSAELRADYATRMEAATRRLLAQLAEARVLATFFVVGEIARSHPELVRDIHAAGHEVGSHSWDHRRVHRFTPASLREDLRTSKDALEQVTGAPVLGFRAPTFSVMRETGWAVDALVDCGFEYDSSIFPVRHDRYGVPDAPRVPFIAQGAAGEILELPPLTYRMGGMNLPVAGGGYFRLFPLAVMRAGLRQAARAEGPNVGMLYFHPWEFDPGQPRLPLKRLSRWRTYVGVERTTARLASLLRAFPFTRAIDAVRAIRESGASLARFRVAG
ncbi:polysaccharide deacetylase family protein [Gemmata sp. JC673]|uniref:Polysaccharide deacetylase family protein n=1 Tax=Gemmata algarum TaxID=2975278 RepID=A0ABU5F942_9BACT|nr:XrtA system polysaccharide deacetylase [Gemmata algarum]MDY3563719.1 polysaccharide deacetylase family protein [Gemmata algarum]